MQPIMMSNIPPPPPYQPPMDECDDFMLPDEPLPPPSAIDPLSLSLPKPSAPTMVYSPVHHQYSPNPPQNPNYERKVNDEVDPNGVLLIDNPSKIENELFSYRGVKDLSVQKILKVGVNRLESIGATNIRIVGELERNKNGKVLYEAERHLSRFNAKFKILAVSAHGRPITINYKTNVYNAKNITELNTEPMKRFETICIINDYVRLCTVSPLLKPGPHPELKDPVNQIEIDLLVNTLSIDKSISDKYFKPRQLDEEELDNQKRARLIRFSLLCCIPIIVDKNSFKASIMRCFVNQFNCCCCLLKNG